MPVRQTHVASRDPPQERVCGNSAEAPGQVRRSGLARLPEALDPDRHETLRLILLDRSLLQLFKDRGIQPAMYGLPEAVALRR